MVVCSFRCKIGFRRLIFTAEPDYRALDFLPPLGGAKAAPTHLLSALPCVLPQQRNGWGASPPGYDRTANGPVWRVGRPTRAREWRN